MNYNPFNKPQGVSTSHGYINYRHDLGTTYVTHRRAEHVYKKYQAFCISNNELDICHQEHVHWVLIIYQNKHGEQTPYRIKLQELQYAQTHTYEGDEQTIIPIKNLEKRTPERWETSDTA